MVYRVVLDSRIFTWVQNVELDLLSNNNTEIASIVMLFKSSSHWWISSGWIFSSDLAFQFGFAGVFLCLIVFVEE